MTNDDWGAVSLASRTTCHTGEQFLHMKYLSVATLRPELRVNPNSHTSEHFSGDPYDPVARLLISPYEVFGSAGLAPTNTIDLVVVLRRAAGVRPGLRALGPDPTSMVEAGEYSEYYEGVERFMNGSLILASQEDVAQHRKHYDELFARLPAVELANVESADSVADRLLNYLYENRTHLLRRGSTLTML